MEMPRTMRAVVIDKFGGPEEMQVREVPVPRPDEGDVLVKVHTAGVGVWDPLEREGKLAEMAPDKPSFPYVLGSDGSGTVAAVGEGVTRFAEGDRVWGSAFLSPKGGFYAEYVPVPADTLARVPDGVDMTAAGAMPVLVTTAFEGLTVALDVRQGETLAILGASGDVGHVAVQLAKQLGARVFAVASGDDGVALARELGADDAIDGKGGDLPGALEAFAPDGLDAALVLTPNNADVVAAALKDGGRLAFPHGVEPEPTARDGVKVTPFDAAPNPEKLDRVNQMIEAGPVHIRVAQTFPLEEIAAAQEALKAHTVGKTVIQVV